MENLPTPPRLAYLISEYPAISHTFVLREVAALRHLGFDVSTCSIRETDPVAHHRGAEEKAAAANTFYVIAAGKNPLTLLRAQAAALRSPGRWWRAFRLAWTTRPRGLRGSLYQMIYFLEAAILARHIRENRIDHLHNHFGMASCTVAMLASVLTDIPYSFTMHGPIVFLDSERWRLDAKIAEARFVVCISDFCRSQAMLLSDVAHWPKLRIVHCGVDPEKYGRTAREGGGKHLVFVGRLAAMKGVPVLLEAFAEVLKVHGDARLTLIGDGPERPMIEARTRELGLEAAVSFAGYCNQDEVAEALETADIFALPSFAEGVPVVLMEAMAARVPVVTTRIAGIGELVEDGVAGRMVPPGNMAAFAAALIEVMDDPERARQMGAAGRRKVEAEFSSLPEAERLGALFREYAGEGQC